MLYNYGVLVQGCFDKPGDLFHCCGVRVKIFYSQTFFTFTEIHADGVRDREPGDVFKLKGRGFPHLGGRGRGDQFVRVIVEVPKGLSGKQKELVRGLEKALSDKNYPKRKSFFDKLKKNKE